MARRGATGCPVDDLPEYAAGRLSPEGVRAVEWHLISCASCVHTLVQERRLRAALHEGPEVPEPVTNSLLALGALIAAREAASGADAVATGRGEQAASGGLRARLDAVRDRFGLPGRSQDRPLPREREHRSGG